LAILGIKTPGAMDGRILSEAMRNGGRLKAERQTI